MKDNDQVPRTSKPPIGEQIAERMKLRAELNAKELGQAVGERLLATEGSLSKSYFDAPRWPRRHVSNWIAFGSIGLLTISDDDARSLRLGATYRGGDGGYSVGQKPDP